MRAIRAVFVCMRPISETAQAERNKVKSKPAPLRLRRLRGGVYPELAEGLRVSGKAIRDTPKCKLL
jgi:hypothetical protein